jgi:hypothetical protein
MFSFTLRSVMAKAKFIVMSAHKYSKEKQGKPNIKMQLFRLLFKLIFYC